MVVVLGGVWDESAIRGLPISFRSPEAGRIVCGLREAKVRNPVMILDEIDKVGDATKNFGDPSAALLELLDPEQNTRFRDVYLDVPVDVSEVLFIATANDLAGIPAPLRDRLEIIEAPGYTDDEKVDIVRRTLWGEHGAPAMSTQDSPKSTSIVVSGRTLRCAKASFSLTGVLSPAT